MNVPHSDALVFFGATGDLAHKKIFPSLQAMIKRGHLSVPVIGVAKAGWNVEQMRARARDGLEKFGGGVDAAAFEKLCSLLRYVDGDYKDAATFQSIRKELGSAQRPAHYLAIPPALFGLVAEQLAKADCTNGLALSLKNPSVTTSPRRRRSIGFCSGLSTRSTSSASTITSASGRCTTWSSSASRMRFWNRSGTAIRSRAYKLLWRRTLEFRAEARSMIKPAQSAMWFKIIYFRSWPTLPWSRR